MSNKILGIDLGTNSIGWTIRDTDLDENQFVKSGVVVFKKGVGMDGYREVPKVQKRTECRSRRRNYQAEKYRKYALLEILIDNGMCPLSMEELNEWRHYSKTSPRTYPTSKDFMNWIRFDFNGDGKPDFEMLDGTIHESYYLFRSKVIDPAYTSIFQSNPMILGRIFYQLVQHRGFKGKDEEEAKTIINGSEKTGTRGRNVLVEYIERYTTLGNALYHYQKETGDRIRKQYTLRKDFEDEIKEICRVQGIDSELTDKICHVITYQRPMRSQKGLVGNCIFERGKKRAPAGHPLYEEYRIWCFINNLKIVPPVDKDLEGYLQENIYPLFIDHQKTFSMDVIKKRLEKDGAIMEANYKDDTEVSGSNILHLFKTLFGADWKNTLLWDSLFQRDVQINKRSEKYYDAQDLWHILNTSDDRDYLFSFANNVLKLDEKLSLKFSKFTPTPGYATLSLSAIKKMLPYLMKGYKYSTAVFMANIHKVLDKPELSESLCREIITVIDEVEEKQKKTKGIYKVINNLIADELDDEYKYVIEDERGLDDSEMNNLKKALEECYGNEWFNLSEIEKSSISQVVADHYLTFLKTPFRNRKNVYLKLDRTHQMIVDALVEKYHISPERIKYLWHPSEQENYKAPDTYHEYSLNGVKHLIVSDNIKHFEHRHPDAENNARSIVLLGEPRPLSNGFKNPMALKTLHELRYLMNYLLETGQIDENTKIVIEIARELNDKNKRRGYELYQLEQNRYRNKAKKFIHDLNEKYGTCYDEDGETNIIKVLLWEEQGHKCLYTGEEIDERDLFNGSKYDIEHTIPASISFDNELKNKTLASSFYNRDIKQRRMPSQLENYTEAAHGYTPIEERIDFFRRRRDYFDKLEKKHRHRAIYAMSKEKKDECIAEAHKVHIYFEYYKEKYKTFTLKEFKLSWRNSQLRDTQIITKYAKPYLETIFKRVVVEKASVAKEFKYIFAIDSVGDKKDRSHHAHHAVDAAVLTLMPNSKQREILLEQHFKAKESNKTFTAKPTGWSDFSPVYVWSIKDNVLINQRSEDRMLLSTKRNVRKKVDGKKVMLRVAGDTIRGQLHDDSFYGAIKQPMRDENGCILFDENGKMLLEKEPKIVIRRTLTFKADPMSSGFKNLEELKKAMVDQNLFEMIRKQVETSDFKTAMMDGVYMLDAEGNKVNKIRRVRCYTSLKNYDNLVKVHRHSAGSDKEYKQYILAKSGENPICLLYENEKEKNMKVLSISELAQLGIKGDKDYFNEPEFATLKKGKKLYHLYAVLHLGTKCLFYQQDKDEIRDILNDVALLSKHLFVVTQFEQDGRMKFKHHLLANDENVSKEYSYFSLHDNPQKMRLTKSSFKFLIEGKDFNMNMDGTIELL